MGRTRTTPCPSGVEIRRSATGQTSLRILFYYRGVLCRESFGLKATANNLRYAARRRAAVLDAIERGTFNYADFFPHSKHAEQFGHAPQRILVKDLLDQHLAEKKRVVEASTYVRYQRNCQTHLYPVFGQVMIQDLTAFALREWIKSLSCQRKTISNILTPLKAIIYRAIADGYIEHNPMESIRLGDIVSKAQSSSQFVIDPFDQDEINTILDKAEGQIKHLYQFAFFSGLRSSELMGLRWGDIDWVNHQAQITETIVDKQTKGTKTAAGQRRVLLLPPALAALKAQKVYTFLAGHRIFHNPLTNHPWETSQQLRRTAWMPLLKRAGVRYRNPYQTRHTYASMMISQGENILWVSKQMGHRSVEVTLKRYTNWIPNNSVKGGYQPKQQWGDYLSKRSPGVVCDTPQMIPQ